MTESQPRSSAETELAGLLTKSRYDLDEKVAERVQALVQTVLDEKKPDLPEYSFIDADRGPRKIEAVVLGRIKVGSLHESIFLTPYGIYRIPTGQVDRGPSMLWDGGRTPAEPKYYFRFAQNALEEIRRYPRDTR